MAWLIRDHALTVLPAVSSLKALRRVARPSAASLKPMIGSAILLLYGDPTVAATQPWLKRARGNQALHRARGTAARTGPPGCPAV